MPDKARAAIILLGLVAFAPAPAGADPFVQGIKALLEDGRPKEAERLARDQLAQRGIAAMGDVEIADLNRVLGDALFEQQRHGEAEPHFRAALALRERAFGPDHAEVAVSAADLGFVLRALGRLDEAEPYYGQALAIRRKALGEAHPDTARSWSSLAGLIDARGRHGEAADAKARAIRAAAEAFGPDHSMTIAWRGEHAAMLHDADRLEEAEAAYGGAISAAEAAFEANDPRLATARQGLANLLAATGRPAGSVPLNRAALAARSATFGDDHPSTAASLERLARTLLDLDDAAAAEPLFLRLVDARLRLEGPVSEGAVRAYRGAGRAAERLRRRAAAEVAYRRAFEISRELFGPRSPMAALDGIMLGLLHAGQMRTEEARPLLRGGVDVLEGDARTARRAIPARTALAFLEAASGNGDEAVSLVERSLRDLATLQGVEEEIADLSVMLADLHRRAGRLDEAEKHVDFALATYRDDTNGGARLHRARASLAGIRLQQGRPADALAIFEERLDWLHERHGDGRPETLAGLADVGRARFALGDYDRAAQALESYVEAIVRLAGIDAATAYESRTGALEDQAISHAGAFDLLVRTLHRLAGARPAQADDHAGRAFEVAQRVIESRAAAALVQMAARAATTDTGLAAMARERQDLVEEWRRADRALLRARSAPAGARDEAAIAAIVEAMESHDGRIREVDGQLAARFPEFAALQGPRTLSLDEARASLGQNEILLFFADAEPETHLWAIPADGRATWIVVERSGAELTAAIRHLREMLGVGPLTRGAAALSRGEPTDRRDAVIMAARHIHDALVGPVADMIAGKDLVVVPSRSLSELPFHLLVSRPPREGAADPYREAGWLVRDHAITVLPAISSLASARRDTAGPPGGEDRQPYIGFANPLLTGRLGSDRRAFHRNGCDDEGVIEPAAEIEALPAIAALYRAGIADVDAVRRLAPLPETLDEACAIAQLLGADAETVIQGADATETTLKRLSAEGSLARARILHFATHGLVAGELSDLAEPAIVLSPPEAGDEDDDGLLTASEISALRLDADWVILSACNTAAGDGGGEALSGLSRAFFYAGARSLLVSHWPVNSDAAVRLATGAVAELAGEPGIGRAEALRRSMLAEIERGGRHAEPGNWAPFVLVGRAGT